MRFLGFLCIFWLCVFSKRFLFLLGIVRKSLPAFAGWEGEFFLFHRVEFVRFVKCMVVVEDDEMNGIGW